MRKPSGWCENGRLENLATTVRFMLKIADAQLTEQQKRNESVGTPNPLGVGDGPGFQVSTEVRKQLGERGQRGCRASTVRSFSMLRWAVTRS